MPFQSSEENTDFLEETKEQSSSPCHQENQPRQRISRSLTYPSMSQRRNTAKTLESVSSHEVCVLADTLTATTQPERKRNNFKMLVVDDDKKTTFSFNTEKHIFPIDFLYAVQPVKNKNKKRRTVEEKGQCPV